MKTAQSIEVLNAIYQRRAIRQYTGEPIEAQTIDGLIDAAIQAPSSMNVQPWAFVVIQGAARLENYSDRIKAHLLSTPGAAGTDMPHLLAENVNLFHGAPVLIIICATADDEQAMEDCSLAAQTLMLAASACELGSCPIGFSRPWFRLAETKREIGIPQDLVPAFSLVLGVPNERPERPERHPPRVIHIP